MGDAKSSTDIPINGYQEYNKRIPGNEGAFEAVSLFAIRATPSRDFSYTLSRGELHGDEEENKKLPT